MLKNTLSKISDDLLVFPFDLEYIKENARLKLSWLMNPPTDHNDPEFFVRAFIDQFVNRRTDHNFPLEALVLGYPIVAGELFGKYHSQMIEEAQRLWEQAEQSGMQIESECPTAPLHLTQNRNDCRSTFVALSTVFGCNPDLLEFVKNMRPADVPGYPYLTSGEVTRGEERKLTKLYESSGLDRKLNTFLSQFAHH